MGQRAQILLVMWAVLGLAACEAQEPRTPEPESYFLWAGVPPPPRLDRAQSVYVLAGEVRWDSPDDLVMLREPPRVAGPQIWLVVRAETLDWGEDVYRRVELEIARWSRSSNLVGVQIDFDSGTKGLDRYGDFLRTFRRDHLPEGYRLSITGLLDWSAHGDPAALADLAGTIDEVVVQTYQGRRTIPDHERYLASLRDLPLPYRVGVVEDGEWTAPAWLIEDPDYLGTVIFLTRAAN